MKVKKIEIKKYFVDSPDIDCDFEPYGRDLVKDYLKISMVMIILVLWVRTRE